MRVFQIGNVSPAHYYYMPITLQMCTYFSCTCILYRYNNIMFSPPPSPRGRRQRRSISHTPNKTFHNFVYTYYKCTWYIFIRLIWYSVFFRSTCTLIGTYFFHQRTTIATATLHKVGTVRVYNTHYDITLQVCTLWKQTQRPVTRIRLVYLYPYNMYIYKY